MNRRLFRILQNWHTYYSRGNKTFEGYFDPAQSFAATSMTFTYDDLNWACPGFVDTDSDS